MELKFKQFNFVEKEDKIRVFFLKIFYFDVNKDEFCKRLDCTIRNNHIFTNLNEDEAYENFEEIFSENQNNLINNITNKHTYYIHENSDVPLIGSNAFGIIDRNTTIIEVKPITGCNLKCMYCSLSEGTDEILHEFLIDADYLFQEIKKLIEYKIKFNPNLNFEIHIGTHGEPLLYFDMLYFVKKVRSIKEVNRVSVNTNGTFLNEKYVKELVEAGLNRFNISINTLNDIKATEIAGKTYPVKKIKDIIIFINKLKEKYPDLEMTLAPVMMKNINVTDVEEIIQWTVENKINTRYGIQNFLAYNTGRKPVKVMQFNKFFNILKDWQDQYKVKLILDKDDYNISYTKPLPKVVKKDQEILCDILFEGRRKGQYIGKYDNRIITVHSKEALKGKVKVKITRTKHNIYEGIHVRKKKCTTCKL